MLDAVESWHKPLGYRQRRGITRPRARARLFDSFVRGGSGVGVLSTAVPRQFSNATTSGYIFGVSTAPNPRATPRSVEICSGAGGLALGLAATGFHHERLVEMSGAACAALANNAGRSDSWPMHSIHASRLEQVHFDDLNGVLDLLAGGVPCQPFSIAGKHRGHRDDRNLFPLAVRAVRESNPKAVLIENVRGLTRAAFRPYVAYIEDQLRLPSHERNVGEAWQDHHVKLRRAIERIGLSQTEYAVTRRELNAADFGTAQRRSRIFFVAFRRDIAGNEIDASSLFVPQPTHSEDALLFDQFVSREYWSRHGLKPRRPAPTQVARIRQLESAFRSTLGLPWRTVRDALSGLSQPSRRGRPCPVDGHVYQPGARAYPGHTGSPLDEPAKTLKAGDHGVPGGENMLRDDRGRVRYFTVREAARLQDFPEWYHFGEDIAWTVGLRLLGNAVPVRLAEAVARAILRPLRQRSR
jgi:DNA (cytosine-5)-methyltransferase 1